MSITSEPPPLHSHHIFIFPFKWNLGDADQSFVQRTDIERLQQQLGKSPAIAAPAANLRWERFQFDWKRDFNEAVYFHPFVRDVLFDSGNGTATTVLQYHIPGEDQGLQYCVQLQSNTGQQPQVFTLEIDELTLNFYDTGIGFFAFHLNNYAHNTPEDVLQINDFGRRIFPQFLGSDNLRLSPPKSAFLADKIEILKNGNNVASDDFESMLHRLSSHNSLSTDFLIPDFIKLLLPKVIMKMALEPLLDDRMHVICWVADKKWLGDFNSFEGRETAGMRWHSLIFVDGSVQKGMANNQQALEYNNRHTYKRWADDDLFYGICRYSFVVLANEDSWFHRNIILNHVQTIYFQIVLLNLLQRGSIVRFSEEITRLSQDVVAGVRVSRHSEAVRSLYGRYLQFVNKIYFREVTPQEQGIELYKMVQDNMEITRDVKALQSEIQDFFNLLDLQVTEQQSDAMNTLTVVGSGLLVPSLILAYYGVSAFPGLGDTDKAFTYHWVPFISMVGMLIGLTASWAWVRCRGSSTIVRWIVGLVAIAAVISVFYVASQAPEWWYSQK